MRRVTGWVGCVTVALALALTACGGGSKSSGPSNSVSLLIQQNARFNDGFTVRWPRLPIRVFTAGIARQDEVTDWTDASGGLVTFTFVNSRSAGDITFRFAPDADRDLCGVTVVEFEESGEITSADVRVVRDAFRTPECIRTVTHEVGHAIGFLDHTTDGGLMDPDGGNGVITAPVRQMIRDLYSMPPGTFVGLEQRPRTALRKSGTRYVLTIVDRVRR